MLFYTESSKFSRIPDLIGVPGSEHQSYLCPSKAIVQYAARSASASLPRFLPANNISWLALNQSHLEETMHALQFVRRTSNPTLSLTSASKESLEMILAISLSELHVSYLEFAVFKIFLSGLKASF